MNVTLPFFDTLKLTMIGMSFNSFMPGAVGGDFVKAYYVCRKTSASKTPTLLSILLDRIIGLYVILLMAGTINIFTSQKPPSELDSLIWFNSVLLASLTLLFLVVFLPYQDKKDPILRFLKQPYLGFSYFFKIYSSLRLLKNKPSSFLKAMTCSLIFQLLFLSFFIYITQVVQDQPANFAALANIYTIGCLSLAIPISPGGLGVGHVVYDKLMMTLGITQGANIYNIMFVGQMALNILGFIPYLLMQNKDQKKTSKILTHTR